MGVDGIRMMIAVLFRVSLEYSPSSFFRIWPMSLVERGNAFLLIPFRRHRKRKQKTSSTNESLYISNTIEKQWHTKGRSCLKEEKKVHKTLVHRMERHVFWRGEEKSTQVNSEEFHPSFNNLRRKRKGIEKFTWRMYSLNLSGIVPSSLSTSSSSASI